MKKSKNTKEPTVTKYKCEFCNREFSRETTIFTHICEHKRRWQDKDRVSNRIAFQAWLQFHSTSLLHRKQYTYMDFIKSPYYTAFVKFGNYCADARVINVPRYVDFLLKNNIRVDSWNTDSNYTKFLIYFMKEEDPLDAIARSIETTIELSAKEKILTKDCLRYGNKNRICYAITTGKISPWMLFQSESGVMFIESLDSTQQKMIFDYINPEQWAIKFIKEKHLIPQIKELLAAGGY